MGLSKPKLPARRAAGESLREAAWAFHATNAAIFEALAKRRHGQSLREYFGTQAFEALSELARAAREARRSGGPRVLLVPGMMGSRLCAMRPRAARRDNAPARARASAPARAPARPRVLWIDPLSIAAGRLEELVLPPVEPVRARGVLLPSYARLKLALDIAGFDARFFPYDWRLGIQENGAALAAAIRSHGKPVILIAHSMGGLVARIAVKRLPRPSVRRLLLLGAPNRGSFAPVQALRGTYPFVRKLSRIDLEHSPDELATKVFNTFPGLYQMLPADHTELAPDLLDPACWPSSGPKPDAQLLAQVAEARAAMAGPDSRMAQIVGVNRPTVIAVRRTAAGFEYRVGLDGDGTVPRSLAMLPGLRTYFADEAHGNLASSPRVIEAIMDLVRGGSTRKLPKRYSAPPAAETRIDDEQLRAADRSKIDWRLLDSAQREAAMSDLEGPAEADSPGSALSLA